MNKKDNLDAAAEIRPAKLKTKGYGPFSAVLVTIGIYFGVQLLIGVLISVVMIALGWSETDIANSLTNSVLTSFLLSLSIASATIFLVFKFLRYRRVSISKIGLVKPRWSDLGYAAAGYIAYFILLILISALAKSLIPALDLNQEQELGFSRSTTGGALILVYLSLVILPPLWEEIAMRGFLYTGLRSKLPFLAAAVVTSIIFALAHLQWGSGNALLWAAALDTFVLSMILVYLREKTGSLISPMIIHWFKNNLAFMLLFIIPM